MTSPSSIPERPTLSQLRIDRGAPASGVPRRRWTWWLLGLGLLGAGAAWWLTPKAQVVQAASVVTTTASQQHVQLTASGYVVAQRRAAVASKATGRLVELRVREGAQVRRGELLARIDASDVQAAMVAAQAGVRQAEAGVRQAEVELINARSELKRQQGLQAQGFISPQALEVVQTRVNAARAAMASAQATLGAAQAQVKVQQVAQDFTEIRAPFDGVVLVKNANVGDIITPLSSASGTQGAVVTMADMTTLEVEADVSEGSVGRTRVGQPVEVMLDALPGVRFMGRVGGIVPTVDRAKATVTTKVKFDRLDPRILPEMSAKVNFLSQAITEADQRPLLAVPSAAIGTRETQRVVWRMTSGPAEGQAPATRWQVDAVAVTPGRVLGEVQEITPLRAGGLKSGDKVVLSPASTLRDGDPVRLAQP